MNTIIMNDTITKRQKFIFYSIIFAIITTDAAIIYSVYFETYRNIPIADLLVYASPDIDESLYQNCIDLHEQLGNPVNTLDKESDICYQELVKLLKNDTTIEHD